MPSAQSLKKQLRHYDQIAFVFLIIVLGYFLIILIVARFAMGIVNFESLAQTFLAKVFSYSFYLAFFTSFFLLIYPSIKAYNLRRQIYEQQAPQIIEQYRLGSILVVVIFISAMALVFWLIDKFKFGSIVELMVLDTIALAITLGAYAIGQRGLDLPKK